MVDKKVDHNTNGQEETKRIPIEEVPVNKRFIPYNEAKVTQMIEELDNWSELNPTKTSLVDFYYKRHGLNQKQYEKLRKQYPELQAAHEMVLKEIGSKVSDSVMYKGANANWAKFIYWQYGDDEAEHDKRVQKLKATEEAEALKKIQPIQISEAYRDVYEEEKRKNLENEKRIAELEAKINDLISNKNMNDYDNR